MKKVKVLAWLFFILGFGISCNRETREGLIEKVSIEQSAIDFFYDSIAFRKIYKNVNTNSEKILLIPHEIDSAWIDNGIFFGYSIYCSGYAETISDPYYDSLTLLTDTEYFSDSTLIEARSYIDYYDSIRNNHTDIKIVLPEIIIRNTKEDFLKRGLAKELFVEVRKGIKSEQTQMVEIVIYKNRLFDVIPEVIPIEFHLKLFYDLKGKILNWYFY